VLTLLALSVLLALLVLLAGLIVWGWSGNAPAWTGFGGEPAKTLWDWLQLLIVPAVLALGALWFNYTQKNTWSGRSPPTGNTKQCWRPITTG
jgi:hypothetical protein